MTASPILNLPEDILVLLPNYLDNIEDYTNFSSTCRDPRRVLSNPHPNTILHLAAAQSRMFFRPSPIFLATATARELGHWARLSPANEALLATACRNGAEGLLDLALQHVGLTLPRIRQLHALRFSVINPVVDLIDKCVGDQWYATPDFWDGGASDAYTIDSEPGHTFFPLAMYGELFGPDIETLLNRDSSKRRLSVDTRLEFVKYCIPEPYTGMITSTTSPGLHQIIDPRRRVELVGPYAKGDKGSHPDYPKQNNLALTWTIRSRKFNAPLKALRHAAGSDFQANFDDGWWYVPDGESEEEQQESGEKRNWRQRMWENMLVCQGLDGLGMLREDLRDEWVETVRSWRERIAAMEKEPEVVIIGRQGTMEYPFLLGDLRSCMSGYVPGT
ncbi:unnamed protein product [Zymoseptoria tritici ST99CH_3D1]|uniref:Uncharacterized protein n=1 Tax=Zymoseptoria tritici (strain ST99CH_3D7) TaxID=1276538 RepID=A0A1X7SA09_ZYMT9|nr:unnamed protein product [Zymoseptoria tritici ST99CH_3D7]SMR64390.1 unnamed protein product [Zymoseptoria tritici ST99CH_3D1]